MGQLRPSLCQAGQDLGARPLPSGAALCEDLVLEPWRGSSHSLGYTKMCGSPFGFCLKPKTGCHKMTHPNPSLNALFGGKGAFVERGVSGQYCLAVEPSWPEHLVADVLIFPEQCLLALGEGQAFPVGPSMSHTMNRLTQVARGNASSPDCCRDEFQNRFEQHPELHLKPMKSAHTSTAL